MTDVLVWWTDQPAAEAVERLVDADSPLISAWPDYLKSEFQSRLGRAGRGRLWIDDRFSPRLEIPELLFDLPMGRWITGACMGGIVIKKGDLRHVRELPGVVTDLDLRRPS